MGGFVGPTPIGAPTPMGPVHMHHGAAAYAGAPLAAHMGPPIRNIARIVAQTVPQRIFPVPKNNLCAGDIRISNPDAAYGVPGSNYMPSHDGGDEFVTMDC